MAQDQEPVKVGGVIQIDERPIRDHVDQVVRATVEETLRTWGLCPQTPGIYRLRSRWQGYTERATAEDRATQGCDPSAAAASRWQEAPSSGGASQIRHAVL